MMTEPRQVSSKDNPLLLKLRRLAADGHAYRKVGAIWLEGDHLCSALRARQRPAAMAVLAESAWQQPALRALAGWAQQITLIPDALFNSISTPCPKVFTDSPSRSKDSTSTPSGRNSVFQWRRRRPSKRGEVEVMSGNPYAGECPYDPDH